MSAAEERAPDDRLSLPVPLPLFSMKMSLDYLMDFYIHTGSESCDCVFDVENPCGCFSEWLRSIYVIWYELGKIKNNFFEQEGRGANPYKEFDLSDMVRFFNEIPGRKTLLTFLGEVDKYCAVRMICHSRGDKTRQRFWYPDGKAAAFPRYKNIEKLSSKCPYT